MNRPNRVKTLLRVFVGSALLTGLGGGPLFGVISPKAGSGAVFPLGHEERIRRDIGQPVPLPARFLTPAQEGGVARPLVEGTYPVPVLLGDFSGMPGTHTAQEFQTLLFDGPWPTGTMQEYYHEISYDRFTIDGTATGWYTLSEDNGYYQGGNNGFGGYPQNAAGFVYELVAAADADVDFGLYDDDGPDGIPNSGDDDGFVDALFAVHAGEGGECGGPWLWSHRSSLSGMGAPVYVTDDTTHGGGHIRVNDYILMPEESCGGGSMIEIGVFAHEFGHSLGLPDLYDGDGSSEGIGGWGLMGSGSWGGGQNSPYRPSHMCAWSKARLGWIDPQRIPRNLEDVSLPQVETEPAALKIWMDGDTSGPEYFLVENRQKVGFDESLLAGGLLIWHIDDSQSGNWNENHYWVDLEEADGRFHLDTGANRGDPGDPYPGSSGNHFFDWTTTPGSDGYGIDTTEISVDFIGDPDSVMTAGIVTVSYPIVGFESYDIDDSGGDGDGVVDIGETVGITFRVHNYGDTPADSVRARIVSSDPALSFPVADVDLGRIEGGADAGNAGEPFTMTVDGETDIHESEFTIELTGTDAFYFAQSEGFLIGHPDVILVADDGADDYSSWYRAALDSLGVPFYERDVFQSGSPADSLEPFHTVIWFTGRETEGILEPREQDSLRAFVEGGGHLFLSGQNIAEDLSVNGAAFLSEVLGVDYGGNINDPILHGVESNPVGAGLPTIFTSGSNGANDQTSRDVLVPRAGTLAAVVYDTLSGDVGAVTRYDPEFDARVVLFGFGFEAINRIIPDDTTKASRLEVMENVVDFLTGPVGIGGGVGGGVPAVPRTFAVAQNYPNPFNPMTTIAWTLPRRVRVILDVYDLRGRRIRRLLDAPRGAGQHAIQWDGRDDAGRPVASGVYLYRLRAGEEVATRRMLMLK